MEESTLVPRPALNGLSVLYRFAETGKGDSTEIDTLESNMGNFH